MKLLYVTIALIVAYGAMISFAFARGSFSSGGSFGRSSVSASRSYSPSTFRSGSTFGKTSTTTVKPSTSVTETPKMSTAPKIFIPQSTVAPVTPMQTTVINHYNSGVPWYYYYWMFGNHNAAPPVTQPILPITPHCCKKNEKCDKEVKPCSEANSW